MLAGPHRFDEPEVTTRHGGAHGELSPREFGALATARSGRPIRS
jgi:hypothetical protein